MEINSSFVRDMNHNYLVLEEAEFFSFVPEKEDFRKRMVLENRISHLLPMEKRMINGKTAYYYEINQMQSLESMYEQKEMTREELKKLLKGCVSLFQNLEEYLLEGEQILLEPAYIYLQEETKEPYFVYAVSYEKDVRESFVQLTDYLLTKIDHTEEKAVMLGYQVYRYTRGTNFVLNGIAELLEKQAAEKTQKEPEIQEESIAVQEKEEEYEKETLYPVTEEKTESHAKRGKMAGLLFSLLLAVCGLLTYLLTAVTGMVRLPQEMQLYVVAEIMLSMALSAFFGIGLRKENKKEKEPYEESYDFFEEETTCLEETKCLETESHFLEGMIDGKKRRIEIMTFPTTVGKIEGEGNLCIKDTTVSRIHARIEKDNGHVYVSDLHSTNGTRKNGIKVAENETVELFPGDEVTFGGACFTFV